MSKDNIFIAFLFAVSVLVFCIYSYFTFNIGGGYYPLFVFTVILGLFLAFNIGGNDVANAFGTSVGAKTLTIKQALLIAAVFELSGALFAGGEVTKTIKDGIVSLPNNIDAMHFAYIMLSALFASGIWIFIATIFTLPVSSTHSVIGGIVGSSIAMCVMLDYSSVGMISYATLGKIALSWVVSPLLGGVIAYMVYAYIFKKILIPTKEKNIQIKKIKKEKKQYKAKYIKEFMKKDSDTQEKELEQILLEDDENSEYEKGLEKFKSNIKALNPEQYIFKHIPILGVIGGLMITSMFLFKSFDSSNLSTAEKIWIMILVSTLSYTVCIGMIKIMKKNDLNKTINRIFSWFQIFTASSFAFSHGANDIANAIGPFVAVLEVLKTNTVSSSASIPFSVMLIFAISLVAGLWFMGKHVIKTVGSSLAKIKPATGFSAELSASIVILLATNLGIPVSSTHILIGAVLGIGVFNKDANWGKLKPIALAWIITLPASALMSGLFYMIFNWIF